MILFRYRQWKWAHRNNKILFVLRKLVFLRGDDVFNMFSLNLLCPHVWTNVGIPNIQY